MSSVNPACSMRSLNLVKFSFLRAALMWRAESGMRIVSIRCMTPLVAITSASVIFAFSSRMSWSSEVRSRLRISPSILWVVTLPLMAAEHTVWAVTWCLRIPSKRQMEFRENIFYQSG